MEQKKIGVMTFHIAHNYGAMLQAYALPTVIKNLGYNCEIIDYRFSYIDSWSRIEYFNDLTKKYGYIIGTALFVKRLRPCDLPNLLLESPLLFILSVPPPIPPSV